MQADEEEEEAEVEQAAASGAAGAAGDHDEEGETPPEQQGEGRKDGGGGGALSARARLLSERLGKEGTRRRRASQAEEMEALPGMVFCSLWQCAGAVWLSPD